jgi:hypothetical protein
MRLEQPAWDSATQSHLRALRTPRTFSDPSPHEQQLGGHGWPFSAAHLEHVETSDDPTLGSHLGA